MSWRRGRSAIPRCSARSIPAGDQREAAIAKSIPVGRLGRRDDVARAVMFFADPENSFVTGQVLYVCGGASVASISL